MTDEERLDKLAQWSARARFTQPLPSGSSDREEALRTGFIAAAIEVQAILDEESDDAL